MIKILEEALNQVAALPEADQEQIGRELLQHALKIRALRADLQAGVDSLVHRFHETNHMRRIHFCRCDL